MGKRPRLAVGGLAALGGLSDHGEASLVCSSDPTLAECRVKHCRMDAWPPWPPVAWLNWAGWSSLVGARLDPEGWKEDWAEAEGHLGGRRGEGALGCNTSPCSPLDAPLRQSRLERSQAAT